VFVQMEALIDDAASRLKHVTFNSQVLEIHQHLAMCRRRGRALRGRDRTLDAVRSRLQGSAARPHLPPRPLVLHGQAGCGKTSVIAKVRCYRLNDHFDKVERCFDIVAVFRRNFTSTRSPLHDCCQKRQQRRSSGRLCPQAYLWGGEPWPPRCQNP